MSEPVVFAQDAGGAAPAAAATELAQKGVSLKTEILSLDKGLASNVSDLLRESTQAKVLNNLHMLKRGVWTTRGTGRTRKNSSAETDSGDPGYSFSIKETAIYTSSAGVASVVAGGYENAVTAQKYYVITPSSGLLSAAIHTLSTNTLSDKIPCMRAFNATNFIMCDGGNYANPYKWAGDTGVAATALGGWPVTHSAITYEKPTICEVFSNRMCFAGFAARPFSIVFSNQNDPGTYTIGSGATDGGVFEVPSQLGPIVGMRALRLSNDSNDQVLIIGCRRGMAMVTGSSGSNFALKELTREYGFISNRTWVQVQNDLYFFGTDGIRRFSQLITGSALINSSVTFPVQDLVSQLDQTTSNGGYLLFAHAVHHPATQELRFYFPTLVGLTSASRAIVLNYNTETTDGNGGVIQPVISTMSGEAATVTGCLEYDGTLYSYAGANYFFQEYSGDTNSDGSAINWEYVSPLIGANSPAQSASLRKIVILTDGPAQKFDSQMYTLDTLSTGVTQWSTRDSKAVDVSASTITDISTWATGTTTTYPKFIDLFSRGNGRFWCLKLSGNATDEHISLVGLQAILTVGGWKQ